MAGAFKQAKAIANLRRADSVMINGPNILVIINRIGAICGIQRIDEKWVAFSYREGEDEPLTFLRAEPSVRRDLRRLTEFHDRQQANPLTRMSAEDEQRAFREASLPWLGWA